MQFLAILAERKKREKRVQVSGSPTSTSIRGRGAFFETMIVSDLIKSSQAAEPDTEWYFWSSPSGLEVDLVERRGSELRAHQIKSGATFRPEQLKNLLAWSELSGVKPENMTLHYDGDEEFVHAGVGVRPWRLGAAV